VRLGTKKQSFEDLHGLPWKQIRSQRFEVATPLDGRRHGGIAEPNHGQINGIPRANPSRTAALKQEVVDGHPCLGQKVEALVCQREAGVIRLALKHGQLRSVEEPHQFEGPVLGHLRLVALDTELQEELRVDFSLDSVQLT
jgi:hypothetical protein